MKNLPKFILIHGTDYAKSVLSDQFIACNGWHKDRGFPVSSFGYFIGYHRLITGRKNYQARLDEDEGAHCNQQVNGLSLNFQSLGVCVGGDFDIEQMDVLEYALLQKQVWEWQDQYSITNEYVKHHRFFTPWKTCPGSLISDAWLRTLLTRPIATPIVPKPPEKMCIAEEKIIAEQKAKISWFEQFIAWVSSRFPIG